MRNVISRYTLILALVVLCVVLSILSPVFLTLSNWLNIVRQVSINGILAVGTTFVVLGGGIDLSIGSVMALAGVVAATLQKTSLGLALFAALAIGTGFGLTNGLLVTRTRTQPFILTLGMGTFARGLTYVYTDGQPIYGMTPAFRIIGGGYIGVIPLPVVIFAVIVAVSYVVLTQTRFGQHTYATGGNEEAARLSGVRTARVKTILFSINGFLAGLAAIVLTSRLNSGEPVAGLGAELDAVAAVVMGGTSLRGGQGGILGTIIGILLVGVVNNGLNLLNVSPYFQSVVKGLVIIGAVLADTKK